MMLYAKEIVTSQRVNAAIKKFASSQQRSSVNDGNSVISQWNVSDYEQFLLLWISETVSALNRRIKLDQLLESQVNALIPCACSFLLQRKEDFKSCVLHFSQMIETYHIMKEIKLTILSKCPCEKYRNYVTASHCAP